MALAVPYGGIDTHGLPLEVTIAPRSDPLPHLIASPYTAHCMGACSMKGEWSLSPPPPHKTTYTVPPISRTPSDYTMALAVPHGGIDTHGFPLEVVALVPENKGMRVDEYL